MKIKKAKNRQMRIKRAEEQRIKVKNQSTKQVLAFGGHAISEQIEGGEEIRSAATTAYFVFKPVTHVVKQGAGRIKKDIRRQQNTRNDKRTQDIKRQSEKALSSKKNCKSSDKKEANYVKRDKRKLGVRNLMYKTKMLLLMKQDINQDSEHKASRWELIPAQDAGILMLLILVIGIMLCVLIAIPVVAVAVVVYNNYG